MRRASRPMRQGDDVLLQVGDDGELPAVEGRVAEAVDAVFGRDLQGDEVAAGAGDDDLGVDDPQPWVLQGSARRGTPVMGLSSLPGPLRRWASRLEPAGASPGSSPSSSWLSRAVSRWCSISRRARVRILLPDGGVDPSVHLGRFPQVLRVLDGQAAAIVHEHGDELDERSEHRIAGSEGHRPMEADIVQEKRAAASRASRRGR